MLLRVTVVIAALAVSSSCESPCDITVNSATTVCLSGNSIQAGVPFVLETDAVSSTPVCEVYLNGSQLDFRIIGNRCTNEGVGSAGPVPPSPARCEVPGLPAGTYSVRGTSTTFTVPGTDAPACAQAAF